jgi:hypothetical protein
VVALTPYLTDSDVKLHCGDALEVLREVPGHMELAALAAEGRGRP